MITTALWTAVAVASVVALLLPLERDFDTVLGFTMGFSFVEAINSLNRLENRK